MQYKMQFTVLDDAVKQNRKLPEIAFFDTDGNLIHLGAGDGGSVDWSEPIPEINFAGDPEDPTSGMNVRWDEDWWGLAFSQPPGADDSEIYLWPDVADDPTHSTYLSLYPGAISMVAGTNYAYLNSGALGIQTLDFAYGLDGTGFIQARHSGAAVNQVMLNAYDQGAVDYLGLVIRLDPSLQINPDPDVVRFEQNGTATSHQLFSMKLDGSLHWGDGTAAPDVSLERTNQGSVQLVGNGEWDYTDFVVGKYNNAGDHANLEMYADAEEAYLAVTYPAGSDLANEILSAHIYGENARYRVHLDGSTHWGGGTAQPDTHLKRTAPGTLEIDHILSFKGDAGDPLSGATMTWDQDEYGLTVEGLPGSGGTWFQVKNPDYVEAAYVSSGSIGVGGPYGGAVAASGGNRAAQLYAESEGAGLRVMGTVGIPDASEFPIIGTLCFPHIGGSNDYGWSIPFTIDFNGAIRWSDPTNYTADQDPFSHTTDVTLQRAAAGVLEIPQHGGGFKLTSPDGSQTKTVRLSNAGALELV